MKTWFTAAASSALLVVAPFVVHAAGDAAELAAIATRCDELERVAATTRRENMTSLKPRAKALVDRAEKVTTELYEAVTEALKESNGAVVASLQERLITASDLADRVRQLHESIDAEAEDVEVRTLHDIGICGVYNELTGKVEWKQEGKQGLSGRYNPTTKRIDWIPIARSGPGPHSGFARVERVGTTYRSTCTFTPVGSK